LRDPGTRADRFDGLVAVAKEHVTASLESDAVPLDDCRFRLRALAELETDGVGLFGADEPADADFVTSVGNYLAARIGTAAALPLVLAMRTTVATQVSTPRDLDEPDGGDDVQHKFLIHRRGDHVGVAVEDIDRGERVLGVFMDDDSTLEVDARESVPLGHKIAVAAVGSDEHVLEYGSPIGKATEDLEVGALVHTHNMRSARW